MRIVFLLLAFVFLAAGVVFGALNPEPVTVDFYWVQLPVSAGFALLLAALAGAVLAGLVLTVSVIWPLRARLRRLQRRSPAFAIDPAVVPSDAPDPEWTVSRTP
ncbi:lipopolysaccharide assembly protein LapA domain-containing protein [Chiayiivirga flava]|uniref:Putative integral membrane protein n=1 Tax=Chiayiivirga flava TaxID=659595 RepID=A0A7W8G155_9GAMM|nr:lipopolysaccharide assembly protein LapA domain-containing protein [Chiayiivirga flava]MBB5208508.1 putative integral membrane protein [Chiayiivirga flava]